MALVDNHLTVETAVHLSRLELEFQVVQCSFLKVDLTVNYKFCVCYMPLEPWNIVQSGKVHLIWQKGGGGEMINIEGGLQKFLDTRKGCSENLYTSKLAGAGELPLPPAPCHIKWTFHYWAEIRKEVRVLGQELEWIVDISIYSGSCFCSSPGLLCKVLGGVYWWNTEALTLFENEGIAITKWFSWPGFSQTNPKWPVIVLFSNFFGVSVDGKHLMCFQSEIFIFKFLPPA